ncbi:hypothetical protein GCM10025857_30240 [Alicyclobacillus contaminans]|nr:hypothetical protein GCM10025857_30240 [Alicyclobacillus contaminans]
MIGFWGDHLAEEGLALGVRYLTLTYNESVQVDPFYDTSRLTTEVASIR